MRVGFGWIAALALSPVGLLALAEPAPAQAPADAGKSAWTAEKCVRYRRGFAELIERRGTAGLSPEFLERHQAFLSSDCTARADVCPRSAAELDVANVLTIIAMNAGTASTFLPFACRAERPR